ncbi:MAG: hypothetical protein ACD_64C00146G0001 [uncultured bacterium]|nr:MAG: hypothetical protein ACD_64C00146G0001 [uncultured bacterium]
MNTKICALLYSCLFFNATMLPMMPDEEAEYIKQERGSLSSDQIVGGMLPCFVCLLMGGMGLMLATRNNNPPDEQLIGICTAFPIAGACSSFGILRCLIKKNKRVARERAEAERADAAAWERAEAGREIVEAERAHVRIAEKIEHLQADLSQKETLELILAARFKKRWQKVQEDFSTNEARYQDDQMKVEHEAMLAKIYAEINEKVGMGLQTNIKSASKS